MTVNLLLTTSLLFVGMLKAQDSLPIIKNTPINFSQQQHYSNISISSIPKIKLGFLEEFSDSLEYSTYLKLKSKASTVIDYNDFCDYNIMYRLLLGENDSFLAFYMTEKLSPPFSTVCQFKTDVYTLTIFINLVFKSNYSFFLNSYIIFIA